jgi:hypothetical protein
MRIELNLNPDNIEHFNFMNSNGSYALVFHPETSEEFTKLNLLRQFKLDDFIKNMLLNNLKFEIKINEEK